MSDNTINAALRRLGYMTAHGFRSMASTLLNEQDAGIATLSSVSLLTVSATRYEPPITTRSICLNGGR